ncbi:MAG: hypothetical protein ABIR32_12480, partial [Ilumatobacteraceae bacterium]
MFSVTMHGQQLNPGYGDDCDQPERPTQADQKEKSMTDTNEAVITEALAVIDKALAEMLRR